MEIQASDILLDRQKNQESDHLFQIPQIQVLSKLEESPMTIGAIELGSVTLPVGEIIPSIEAVDWFKSHKNVDIRPRLVDSSSGEARLLDSGAQLSATRRRPEELLFWKVV